MIYVQHTKYICEKMLQSTAAKIRRLYNLNIGIRGTSEELKTSESYISYV